MTRSTSKIIEMIQRNAGYRLRFSLNDGTIIDAYVDEHVDLENEEGVMVCLYSHKCDVTMNIYLPFAGIDSVEYIFEECKTFAFTRIIQGLKLAPQGQKKSFRISQTAPVLETRFENILFKVQHIDGGFGEPEDDDWFITANGLDVWVKNKDLIIEVYPTVGQENQNG